MKVKIASFGSEGIICAVIVTPLSVQEMLDKILPALIPLGIVLLSYWLLGKKKMNSTRLIFVLILIGMVLGNLQPMLAWVGGLF